MLKHPEDMSFNYFFVANPLTFQISNGFQMKLVNSQSEKDQYEMKVTSSLKGVISMEINDLQEKPDLRFKVIITQDNDRQLNQSGVLNDYRT